MPSGDRALSKGLRPTAAPKLLLAFTVALAACVSAQDIRLKQNFVPRYYRITITPDLASGNFTGLVSIDLSNPGFYSSLTLHAKDIDIRRVTFKRDGDSSPIRIHNHTIDAANELATINFAEEIYTGKYTLEIGYAGKIRDDMTGFYRSYYYGNDGQKRWLGATQFEAPNARKAFPCFDEPHFRTGFEVNFLLPQDYDVISNTKKDTGDGDRQALILHTFKSYPTMPTYLLAWIIYERSSFVPSTSNIVNGIDYRVWSQEKYAGQTEHANIVGARAIEALANFTGVPYKINGKLEKMDQVAVPDFDAGAMENWGLVTYRENRLLYDDKNSTTEDLRDTTMVITHEFTHQWFGDRVTLDWWSYTWLNEAFARYFQYFITAKLFPSWRIDQLFNVNALQVALDYDSKHTHPMTSDIVAHSNISSMFDVVTYSKGASIVRMMEHILTPPIFQKGINRYLETMSNNIQVAKPEDLFRLLTTVQPAEQKATHRFDKVIKGWTEQQGFPLITVTRNYTSGVVTVSQERFLYEGAGNETWYVPLTFTSQSNNSFYDFPIRAWLTPEVTTIQIPRFAQNDHWVVFNVQAKGFYRVNYDDKNWRFLISQLRTKYHPAIHVLNKAQLIDDAFSLAQAGKLNYSVVFDLTAYLVKEDEYIPWVPAVRGFNFLFNQYAGTALYDNLKTFVLKLIAPSLSTLAFNVGKDEEMPTKSKRILLLSLAAKLDHEEANKNAQNLVKDLTGGTKSQFSADVRKALLCSGLRSANVTVWNNVFEQMKSAPYATQVVEYIRALACTEVPAIIKTYLDSVFSTDSPIRRQDAVYVYNGLSSTRTGATELLKYVLENYAKIIAYDFGKPKIIGTLISGMSDKIFNATEIAPIDDFILNETVAAALGETVKSINGTLRKAERRLEWRQTYLKDIENGVTVASLTTTTTTTTTTTQATVTNSTTTKPGNSASSISFSTLLIAATTFVTFAYQFKHRC